MHIEQHDTHEVITLDATDNADAVFNPLTGMWDVVVTWASDGGVRELIHSSTHYVEVAVDFVDALLNGFPVMRYNGNA